MSDSTDPLLGKCTYCPRDAEAVVPVLYGAAEIEEPVCMVHVFGPDGNS